MKHNLICNWLGLSAENWPPTHYQLLGLEPGEKNVALIEQRVQQRLDTVRRYQLAHPDQATEALNRLAQAYVCLTEPAAKQRYDASILDDSNVAVLDSLPANHPCVSTDTPVPGTYHLPGRMRNRSTPAVACPPPLPDPASVSDQMLEVPGITPEEPEDILDDAAIEATLPPLVPTEELPDHPPVCPLEEAARSRTARVGLCTRRGILRRIQLLRQLLRTWNNIGRLLPHNPSFGAPSRKLNPRSRGQALLRNLNRMQELLNDFPQIFGEAGQSGFLVLGLLEQEQAAYTLHTLDDAQLAKLAEDWRAGYDLLRAHGRLLTELTSQHRNLGFFQRWLLNLRSTIVHQPVVAAILLILIGGNLILWLWNLSRWW